jgi:hypothetical protein
VTDEQVAIAEAVAQARLEERAACAKACEQVAHELARQNKQYKAALLCRDAIAALSRESNE